MTFAPGDVVALKSGGHSMTVASVGDEDIDCLWVNEDGALLRQSIPAVVLIALEMSEGDEDSAEEERDSEEDEDDEESEEEDDEERGKKRAKKR